MGALATTLALALLAAVDVPDSEGWVTDRAGFLSSSERQSLSALMESYDRGSNEQIALLTVNDLGGKSIDAFAFEVARAWSKDGAGEGGGILMVVAKKERRVRIEVGRSFEGRLPDTLCARIIDHVMVPQFKRGRFDNGIRDGIVAIHEALGGNYAPIDRSQGGRRKRSAISGIFSFLFMIIMMVVFGRRSGGGRGGSGGGWLSWLMIGSMMNNRGSGGFHGGFGGDSGSGGGSFGGFGGFSGGGGFGGGGASGGW